MSNECEMTYCHICRDFFETTLELGSYYCPQCQSKTPKPKDKPLDNLPEPKEKNHE